MVDSDYDEFDFSSDADEAMIALADEAPKRKHDDEADSSLPLKRLKSYAQTSELARSVLKRTFKLDSFRLKQEMAIARLLEGGNTGVIFPTGGGKSLCYQVRLVLDTSV
jgi:superfamily II DNA helicase RecQ